MKKISILYAAMIAALGFSSCNETWDDSPVLGVHEGDIVENFLNEPEMGDMAVMITETNNTETFHLVCSQPKQYGYAASVGYQVEVSFDKDFTNPEVEGCPASVLLPTIFKKCDEINPTRKSVAEAMCKMLNIMDPSQVPTDYFPLYMRLHANIVNESGKVVPNTSFISNTVCFKNVACGYLAIIVPGLPTGIYVRGDMNGWLNAQLNDNQNLEILPNYEFLTTSEAETYELDYIEIPKDTKFKIADKGWGEPNLGLGESGAIVFGEKYEFGWNTGDITLSSNFKGSITLKGSGQKWEATFDALEAETPGKPSGIFLRGDMNGWDTTMEFLTTDVKNTWEIKNVTISPTQTFKVADASWGDINFGATKTDGVVDKIVPGVKYTLEKGGDNIQLEDAFSGTVTLRLKSGKYTLTLVAD